MATSQNHLFLRTEVQNGQARDLIFWSPKEKHFPAALPSRMLDREDLYDYTPKDTWSLHWSKNRIPHLMFIPSHPTFEGPIFQRLACNRASVPLELVDGYWYLAEDLRIQWDRLESALEMVTTMLYGDRLFSLGYKHKWPCDFGYLKGFIDPKTARRCAIKSRDGFVELMGLCAHAIALSGPNWKDILRERMRDGRIEYPPVWMDNLAKSLAGDIKNVPRVGVIVDPKRCEWLTWIPRLRKANVPIYFYWGHVNSRGYPTPCETPKGTPDLGGPTEGEVKQFLIGINHSLDWNAREFGQEGFLEDLVDDEPEPAVEMPPPPPPGSDLATLYARVPTPWAIRMSKYLPSIMQPEPLDQEPLFLPSPSAASTSRLSAPASRLSATPSAALPTTTTLNFPIPKPQSRQKRGETWQEFFARQERRHKKYLEIETKEERQSRQRREKYAKTSSVPSNKSRVFRWMPDEDTGFLMREVIFKGVVKNFWKYFAPTQRRFNAIDNEWDLCKEFDPTVDSDSEEDDDYDEISPTMNDPSGTASSAARRKAPPLDILNKDLLDIYRPELESELLVPPLPLERVLFLRYGFAPPPGYVANKPIVSLEWAQARAILCDSTNESSVENQGQIVEFVSHLLNQPAAQCIPRSVSDLSAACPRYLRTFKPSVPYERIQCKTQISANHALETVTTYKVLMGINGGDSTRLLLVDKAATVLHILRKEWNPPSASLIISYLLSTGTPFRMVTLRQEHPGVISMPMPVIGLGTRDKGFRGGLIDYIVYEGSRDLLFSDDNVLRCALQEGGILWRLAHDYLQKDLGADCVLDGPSSFTHVAGRPFLIGERHFIDDQLTEEQIGLICGVYRVRTDSTCYKDQVAEMSWWPKPNAWEKSGLNVGYWSADCESWYQRRLENIRTSKVELRSGGGWKQAMRLQKKARHLVDAYEEAAGMFLGGHIFE